MFIVIFISLSPQPPSPPPRYIHHCLHHCYYTFNHHHTVIVIITISISLSSSLFILLSSPLVLHHHYLGGRENSHHYHSLHLIQNSHHSHLYRVTLLTLPRSGQGSSWGGVTCSSACDGTTLAPPWQLPFTPYTREETLLTSPWQLTACNSRLTNSSCPPAALTSETYLRWVVCIIIVCMY